MTWTHLLPSILVRVNLGGDMRLAVTTSLPAVHNIFFSLIHNGCVCWFQRSLVDCGSLHVYVCAVCASGSVLKLLPRVRSLYISILGERVSIPTGKYTLGWEN